MEKFKIKITASLILLSLVGGILGNAFIAPRPVYAFFGFLKSALGLNNIQWPLATDLADEQRSSIEATADAAKAKLQSDFGKKTGQEIAKQATIENFDDYTEALTNIGFTDSMFDVYENGDRVAATDPSDPSSIPGDVAILYNNWQNLSLLNGSITTQRMLSIAKQSFDTAAADFARKEAVKRQIENIMVGGIASFASSISCGGFNAQALTNASKYMAAATTGVIASDISTQSGLGFYSGMAGYGQPTALPWYWQGVIFPDQAAYHESRARTAANLEIISPGLKATKDVPRPGKNTPSGTVETERATQLYIAQQFDSLDQLTSSLENFGKQSAVNLIAQDVRLVLNQIADNVATAITSTSFGEYAAPYIRLLAYKANAKINATAATEYLIAKYARTLFQKAINEVFVGKFLKESAGCRKRAKTSDAVPVDVAAITIPGVSSSPEDLVIFSVLPDKIETPSARDAGVLVEWDASAVIPEGKEGNYTVTVTPSPTGCPPPHGPIGLECKDTDLPQSGTKTYTLTVIGPGVNVTKTGTVLVQFIKTVDPALVSLKVNGVEGTPPPSPNVQGDQPFETIIEWSVTLPLGSDGQPDPRSIQSFTIEPLGDQVQSLSDRVSYIWHQSGTVTLQLLDITGQQITKSVDVFVNEPPPIIVLPPPPPTITPVPIVGGTAGAFLDGGGASAAEYKFRVRE
ncbi:MAG: hypothetical protein Q8R08_02960 [bacterium]|nr:hypothetical protein [bacterium]